MDETAGSGRDKRVAERAERFGYGGVGLEMETANPPRPRAWLPARRGLRVALALSLLLTTAAGFAGGTLWSGQRLNRLALEEAVSVVQDQNRDKNSRIAAMTQLLYFAKRATEVLIESTEVEELEPRAKLYSSVLSALHPRRE